MDDELHVEQILIGSMQNFTYVIGSKETREVALVDPAWNIEGLLEHVQGQGWTPTAALITHYHPDHCGGEIFGQKIEGLPELMEQKPLPVYVHKEESAGLKKVTGISDSDMRQVESGDTLRLGNVEVEFLHTPGHTPGSQCFRIHDTLVSGDTLFIQGCGRVDLPGSNADDMYASLQKLATLPEDTVLLPGHDYGGGNTASLEAVKAQNPYLRIPTIEMWREIMGSTI